MIVVAVELPLSSRAKLQLDACWSEPLTPSLVKNRRTVPASLETAEIDARLHRLGAGGALFQPVTSTLSKAGLHPSTITASSPTLWSRRTVGPKRRTPRRAMVDDGSSRRRRLVPPPPSYSAGTDICGSGPF